MKEKKEKTRKTPFSDMSVSLKFIVLDFWLLLAVAMVFSAMLRAISAAQKEKYTQMERTVITASEQITDMAVDTAVAIAKNIYSNETIYTFLNKKYASSSEYYEAYYPLQQNTAMRIADTNVVNGCTIYTENPTVLTGGNLKKLDSAKNEYWYKCFKKLNKSTILCIDPDTASLVLVRKLDYVSLDTGESFLCMEINKKALVKNFENLGFDGDLYLMSGGTLIYSSSEDVSEADQIEITPEFDCITRNYYSADIEYYSKANKNGFRNFVLVNKILLITLAVVIIMVIATGYMMSHNIKRRIRTAENDFNKSGSTPSLVKGRNGKDEIGTLLDICCSMSERLKLKGSEYKMSSDSLMQKISDYDSLYATAMRLDAELTIINKFPDFNRHISDEYVTLGSEIEQLEQFADIKGAEINGNIFGSEKILIPAYSLLLIADDIFRTFSNVSINLHRRDDQAFISFLSDTAPKSSDTLKFHAIFEENGISDEYSFDRSSRINPYLRLKHCLGSSVDAEIKDKDSFKVTFRIKYQKEKVE